jgi:hypothetical protein
MIHEVRIFDRNNRLKRIISSEEATRHSLEEALQPHKAWYSNHTGVGRLLGQWRELTQLLDKLTASRHE